MTYEDIQNKTDAELAAALISMAGQENHDGEEYDLMQVAGERIKELNQRFNTQRETIKAMEGTIIEHQVKALEKAIQENSFELKYNSDEVIYTKDLQYDIEQLRKELESGS